jgi:hypothetical protein
MDGTMDDNKEEAAKEAARRKGGMGGRRASLSQMVGGLVGGSAPGARGPRKSVNAGAKNAAAGALGISTTLSSIRRESHNPTLDTFCETNSPKAAQIRLPKAAAAAEVKEEPKSPDRILERRKSFVADLQTAFDAGNAGAASSVAQVKGKKTVAHSHGITFEEFSKQFFELMTSKVKEEGIISDPNVKGVELDFKDICL